MDASLDIDSLRQWIGHEQRHARLIDIESVQRMAAVLEREHWPQAGETLPLLWHWMFLDGPLRSRDLGPDGHARKGLFLPDIPLPRRMWAGSRLRPIAPLRVGECVERHSRIHDVQIKHGRGGVLVIVTVRQVLSVSGSAVLEEEQDLVYRDAVRSATAPRPAPETADTARDEEIEPQFSRTLTPDAVLLFRYSALTFNAHRIHYDRDYAVNVEGHPGLVVHAPLTASLLMALLEETSAGRESVCGSLQIRALRPLYAGEPLKLNGRRDAGGALLWAQAPDGGIALRIELTAAAP